jgi:hypothetical protein
MYKSVEMFNLLMFGSCIGQFFVEFLGLKDVVIKYLSKSFDLSLARFAWRITVFAFCLVQVLL